MYTQYFQFVHAVIKMSSIDLGKVEKKDLFMLSSSSSSSVKGFVISFLSQLTYNLAGY